MHVALVQMEGKDGQPEANLAHAETLIRAYGRAELYLLPELWTTGYHHKSWSDYVTHHHDKIIQHMQGLCQELKAWIGGSYVVSDGHGGYFNRFVLLSPDASTPIHYDKVHLFTAMDEDKRFGAGKQRINTQVGDWCTSLSICYDLRFPGMYRQSALDGATLFLIPAQWPRERCHHMVDLAKARAIENQAYVVLCNRIGPATDDIFFGGQSGIWSPDGTQLCNATEEDGIFGADIEINLVQKLRQAIPVLNHHVCGVDT